MNMEEMMKPLLRCSCGSIRIIFVDKKGAYCENCVNAHGKKKKRAVKSKALKSMQKK